MTLEVISLGLDAVGRVLVAKLFDGLVCRVKNSDGMAQRDIDQPRAWDWLLMIVDCVMYDSRFFRAGHCQCKFVSTFQPYSLMYSEISCAKMLISKRESPLMSEKCT